MVYAVVRRWLDRVNAKPPPPGFVARWQALYEAALREQGLAAGPVPRGLVYTSNVDGLAARVTHDRELLEMHGQFSLWQCEQRCAASGATLWRVPRTHRFDVDPVTLLLRPRAAGAAPVVPDAPDDQRDTLDAGQVAAPERSAAAFSSAFPSCPFCGGHARPAICMFEDVQWSRCRGSWAHYTAWVDAFMDALEHEPGVRLVVVEVGCGKTVPSVRMRSENVVYETLWKAGHERRPMPHPPVLVRVNPDWPDADSEVCAPHTVPLRGRALATLLRLDALVVGQQPPPL